VSGDIRQVGHVLLYPPRGRLIFATDFHGQIDDFRAVVAGYTARRAAGEDVYLLFAGDFVHGPAYSADRFPDHLGDFHEDGTLEILAELETLLDRDPRVRSLLGNHEHAHIGGPHTQKFHKRPDEVEFLEARLGPEGTARAHNLFRRFALVALTRCGILFMHAAPQVRAGGFAEVASVPLDGYGGRILDIYDVPIIGELLWAKAADPEIAAAFLERMAYDGMQPRLAVYGHDIIREGMDRVAANQLIVSTSFGLRRAQKTLCEVDLGGKYETVDDLREGLELVALYPE
jgi:hypothetical protein